mgnify:CR=1 FL=1
MVIEYKICSIEYFFDKMQFYELNTILSSLNKSIKNTWEQTRMIAYTIAQCNSTKQLKPTDILKFDWDNNDHKQEIITNIRRNLQNYDIMQIDCTSQEQFCRK